MTALAEQRKGWPSGWSQPSTRPSSPSAERIRRKKRDLTVDAVVAATAVELAPSVVITADTSDLELLVGGFDVRVSAV